MGKVQFDYHEDVDDPCDELVMYSYTQKEEF
jgi:hypothetical protein